jgi:hypothetical protein
LIFLRVFGTVYELPERMSSDIKSGDVRGLETVPLCLSTGLKFFHLEHSVKGYQPRINIIKDENGNLIAHPQNVLNRWKNFFNQVLNVHGVCDVRQMDIHTAEPLVPEPSLVEVEIAIGKLNSYKSPGTDNIPSKLIKAGAETLYSEIHRLICCVWNKEELPQQWKEHIIVPIYKKGNKTDCNNY